MKKRSHKVVVEITTDKPITSKEAVWAVRDALNHYTSCHYLSTTPKTLACRIHTKEFRRVVMGLLTPNGRLRTKSAL